MRGHLFTYLVLVLFGVISFQFSFAQQKFNYDKEWKKVDSLVTRGGLTRSALTLVNNIYDEAKKEKDEPQIIKSLIYKLSLQENIEENGEIKNIQQLEHEIAASDEPSRSILENILAAAYLRYLQVHRWVLYDRTKTINFKKEDIATWGIEDLHQKITSLYLESIRNENLLRKTPLEPYDAIIIRGNVRYLRPTLFDLLAHNALEYFKNDERYIDQPSYAYKIKEPEAFADAKTFASHHFHTTDSLSLHYKAMLLFQELINFHLQDNKPAALIDVDIERVTFVHRFAIMDNEESLYLGALEKIANQYPGEGEALQASYLIADAHFNKGNSYDPLKDTSNRFEYVVAKNILNQIVATKDSSFVRSNARQLLDQIAGKEVQLQIEKVNVPGQPFRMLVTYKNATLLNFRLLKYDDDTRDTLAANGSDEFWVDVLHIPAMKTFSQTLPATNDYQRHRVEIKIDALPVGNYALLVSTNNFIPDAKENLLFQELQISNLSFIASGEHLFVLNRTTGQPISNVSVEATRTVYNEKTKKNEDKTKNFKSDKNGHVLISFDPKIENTNTRVILRTQADSLKPDELYEYRYRNPDDEDDDDDDTDRKEYEEDNAKMFFFTDRSIYRPGQTVYFKAIAITKDFKSKQSKIIMDFESTFYLEDPNNVKIDSIKIKTNEFGSVSGKFKLPENRLNGEFSIVDYETTEHVDFSVEEYKRPKFEVAYDKQKGSYKLYDSISVVGTAKAYAGNKIDGANVKYTVKRVARFPYPWLLWRRSWYPRSDEEIAHGETKTNAEGKFIVKFAALPDESIEKQYDPVFDYSISSDVTDINGETHSGETTLSVGYKSLLLSVTVPTQRLLADSLKQFFIRTTSQSGEYQPASVKVSIWKLDVPKRLIRTRSWSEPDQFVMTKNEYIEYFPHDEYSNETKKENWARVEKVFERTDSSRMDGRFSVKGPSYSAGWYAVDVVTHDKEGNEVKDIRFFQLSNSAGRSQVLSYNWYPGNNYFEQDPNTVASLPVGSSAENVFVIKMFDRKNQASNFETLALNNEVKSSSTPINESDRGGFGVSFAFVKDNAFYTSTYTINVPWTNKQLNISYATFRDKTLPGSEEKWKVKIAGYYGEKVAAEVLTSMYDASLDQLKEQKWETPRIWASYSGYSFWNATNDFQIASAMQKYWPVDYDVKVKIYDELLDISGIESLQRRMRVGVDQQLAGKISGVSVTNSDGLNEVVVTGVGVSEKKMLSGEIFFLRGQSSPAPPNALIIVDGMQYAGSLNDFDPADIQQMQVLKGSEATALYGAKGANGVVIINTKSGGGGKKEEPVQIRKNFNETAFFFPELRTDTAGNVEFSFTMPEALTQWKWMTFAHTKDLAFGYAERNVVTQKDLMLQPNLPRFLREGDLMELSTKIVNLADSEVTGQVQLLLIDPTTNQSVDGWFQNMYSNQYFTAPAKGSVAAQFSIQIPHAYNKPVIIRLVARAGNVSDGEENELPVLTNKVLVTETLPLNMKGSGTKEFKFEKLLSSEKSETLQQHALTVEFTSNPSWYAVQALPYLMEFPYECAEQTFNRFYANALGTRIINASPKVKAVFDKWKTQDTAAFLSNLEKNQELKSILLQETPWVVDAKSESEQKKRLALLFDLNKMSSELSKNLDQVMQSQSNNGGFTWFKGGPDDRYITQYIISGIGHLKTLNAIPTDLKNKIDQILKSGLAYLDNKIKEDYDRLIKSKADLSKQQIGYDQVQYLYMRSFFNDQAVPGSSFQAYNYYRKQAQQFWLQQNRYMQGMIALALFRTGDGKTSFDILRSLKQNAIVNQEMGMYWKDIRAGYYWYQAPIETQSLLIEAFATIYKDNKITDDLKTWLLKNKQTNNWSTTKATADACYGLLLQGTDWLSNTPVVHIKLGDKTISSTEQAEAGTGYFKKTFDGQFVTPSMGNISVSVNQPAPATVNKSTSPAAANAKAGEQPINYSTWGAVYWQYFEESKNITSSATPLSIVKKLFVQRNTNSGPVLEPVENNSTFKVGDKVKVRIELRVDRDMEYVHMKDMRAASFEPVDVISEYKWQGGLGYYQSTKDASTNFFFDYIRKGTYVFEYEMFASQVGTFSNGITTIQCMYAPEFSSHSEGLKVTVEGQ